MAGLLVLQIVEFVSNEVFTLAAFDSMAERLHDSTVSTTAVRSATPEVEPTTLAAFYSATHIDSPKVTRASQSVVKIEHTNLLGLLCHVADVDVLLRGESTWSLVLLLWNVLAVLIQIAPFVLFGFARMDDDSPHASLGHTHDSMVAFAFDQVWTERIVADYASQHLLALTLRHSHNLLLIVPTFEHDRLELIRVVVVDAGIHQLDVVKANADWQIPLRRDDVPPVHVIADVAIAVQRQQRFGFLNQSHLSPQIVSFAAVARLWRYRLLNLLEQ